MSADFSHRGFPISIFIRRKSDTWEVTTTIYAPEDLIQELGDRVTMDVIKLPTPTESSRSDRTPSIKQKRLSTVSCVIARQQHYL